MQAGIALQFRQQFGEVEALLAQQKKVGEVATLQIGDRWLFYLISKPRYFHKPNPRDVERCLLSLRSVCESMGLKELCIPRIGCGLDGLSWRHTVRPMLCQAFEGSPVCVTVYTPGTTQQKTDPAEDLKGTLALMIRRNYPRGYRSEIEKRYGGLENFLWQIRSPKYKPGLLELRALAEFFYLRIPVHEREESYLVGCKTAPVTPAIHRREDVKGMALFCSCNSEPDDFGKLGHPTVVPLEDQRGSHCLPAVADGEPVLAVMGAPCSVTLVNKKYCSELSPLAATGVVVEKEPREFRDALGSYVAAIHIKGHRPIRQRVIVANMAEDLVVGQDIRAALKGYLQDAHASPTTQPERNQTGVLRVNAIQQKGGNLFTVSMDLQGNPSDVTVDTAASRSLVSRSLVPLEACRPCEYSLLAANDGELRLTGQCTLALSSGDRRWLHTFLVHEQQSPALRLLLGNDFHDRHQTNVDFKTKTFTIPGELGPTVLPRLEKGTPPGHLLALADAVGENFSGNRRVSVAKGCTIPPESDRWVPVTFHPWRPTEVMLFCGKDVKGAGRAWDLLLEPDDDHILVTNLSSEPLTIDEGAKLGFLLQNPPPHSNQSEAYVYSVAEDKWDGLVANLVQQEPLTPRGNDKKREFRMDDSLLPEERAELGRVLQKYADVFDWKGDPFRTTNVMEVRLPLKDPDKVIYQHNYALRPSQTTATRKVIKDMLEQGILERAPHSNYRIPFMIVEKGVDKETNEMKYRLVLSAKKLNEALAKINYGPPRIPDVLSQLKGQDLYSVIDLSSSFHQLAVDERDRHILTIQHEGQLYRYKKMPMGLSVSSQYLCYALTLALRDALFNTCLSYVDDTIVFSRGGMGAHAAAVEDVLSRFRRANFGVNGEKCTFGYKKVGFLGYIVDGEGYRPNPDKFRELEKLLDVKTPREAKRAYCYFSYYRSFIPNFHKIAHPVLEAGNADKETFRWGETEQQAVATLHRGLLKEVTLVHFDDRRHTIITVDGSPVYGAGAVMFQKCSRSRKYRPVSVLSKTFPRIQRSRAPYETELLALKYTLEHWRPELLALPAFEIRTDCASLKTLPAHDKVTSNQATVQRLLGEFSGKYKIIRPPRKWSVPTFIVEHRRIGRGTTCWTRKWTPGRCQTIPSGDRLRRTQSLKSR
ncbi:hypothetical protein ONE63_011133 [Megalurothrips usitatus]|uniref:Reverse transcriptase domain-containing protein n=1 Tax=Megalurothrips usitatus TaxID=439358 RepID=A0AAV7XJS0_9NEOP|nr:hypothetical protein ONE63_011133 [Megalurothrips usitatus]